MDFNKPCVIQEDYLCLLNFTHLLGMCLLLERKISLHSLVYFELGSAIVFFIKFIVNLISCLTLCIASVLTIFIFTYLGRGSFFCVIFKRVK